MSEHTLNNKQSKILQVALEGHKMMIIGPPGVGKTFLINKIRADLLAQGKEVAITAMTGTAASLLIDGQTIHRFTGTGPDSLKIHLPDFPNNADSISKEYKKYIQGLHTVILDEASMLSPTELNHLDLFFQKVRGKRGKYFGGLQVILVGDVCQIHPMDKSIGPGTKRRHKVHLDCIFCYPDDRYDIFVLDTFVRQAEDPMLQQINLASIDKNVENRMKAVRLLNHFGSNKVDLSDDRKIIRFSQKTGAQIITPTNKRVEKLIEKEIEILEGCKKVPQMISGPKPLHTAASIQSMTASQLRFLGGPSGVDREIKEIEERHSFEKDNLWFYPSQIVRITRNGETEDKIPYLNGDLCIFQEYKPKEEIILVKRIRDQRIIPVPRVNHLTEYYKEVGQIGFEAFPLVRSVASTVHKIQGQTLSKIIVDPTGLHNWNEEIPQMINVMFSRVKKVEDIYLTSQISERFMDSPEIKEELENLWELDYMKEYPRADQAKIDAYLALVE